MITVYRHGDHIAERAAVVGNRIFQELPVIVPGFVIENPEVPERADKGLKVVVLQVSPGPGTVGAKKCKYSIIVHLGRINTVHDPAITLDYFCPVHHGSEVERPAKIGVVSGRLEQHSSFALRGANGAGFPGSR